MKIYSSFYSGLLAFIAECRAAWPSAKLDVYVTQPVFVVIGGRFHGHDVHIHASGDVMGVLIEGPSGPSQRVREIGKDNPVHEVKGRRESEHRELVNEPRALEEMEEACVGK